MQSQQLDNGGRPGLREARKKVVEIKARRGFGDMVGGGYEIYMALVLQGRVERVEIVVEAPRMARRLAEGLFFAEIESAPDVLREGRRPTDEVLRRAGGSRRLDVVKSVE